MFQQLKAVMGKSLLLCLILILGACSTGSDDQDQSTDKKTGSEKTRMISTVMGDVEVPAHPERVVVDWHLGQVMALGLMPVGAPSTLTDYGEFLKPLVSDKVEDIGQNGAVSLEKVLELEPDLIITWDQDAAEKYSKIAPTVVYDSTNYNTIHEEITAMGEILNRQEKAKEWLVDFDQRVDAAKDKIKGVIPEGTTFTIADYFMKKNVIIMGDQGGRGGKAAYKLLELTPAPRVKSDIIDQNEGRIDVSWETVGDYIGDYVIAMKSEASEAVDLPTTWTTLDTIKKNRVYEFDMKKFFSSDPISVLYQTEEIADELVKRNK
ncbi:ABC transporter substrate-binding protein [Sporosarcina sp. resist]|uniref:ABC transporter substrate-binding protein n=1 Tax=Sporosarcina sp. resist TaxID=2762563 RepID=UPI00164D9885|nr:ABC transporter substrate-binding protein [Sporosarcina sp. resist]QNK89158.1 ABC transporter substrate-binding protein [Sporosarcina sp. resist]